MNRLLLIALDAADFGLVETWMADGSMPELAALRRRGAGGPLASFAEWLSGATWPTFASGCLPVEHGRYHFLQWRAGSMRFTRPRPDWLPLRPFWREFADPRCRVLVIDPPLAYRPEPVAGIEIVGIAAHDRLQAAASWPPGLQRRLEREFGRVALRPERHAPSAALQLRDQLLRTTAQLATLAASLLRREDWRFALVCLTATHRAGHRLWPTDDASGPAVPADALRQVYMAGDAAVGELVAAAGAGTTCLVFALQGMQENSSRVPVLPEMLQRVLGARPRQPLAARWLDRVPEALRSPVKVALPLPLQDALSNRRAIAALDWERCQAFPLISDLAGYVRGNIRGRERRGTIPAGRLAGLLGQIRSGLGGFVDATSGDPVVAASATPEELFGRGPRLDLLPDLCIRWPSSPARHQAIESAEFGLIRWPGPGAHPTGRGGNHRDGGFVIAAGGPFRPGAVIRAASTLDLKPTALELLGFDPTEPAAGRSLASRQE